MKLTLGLVFIGSLWAQDPSSPVVVKVDPPPGQPAMQLPSQDMLHQAQRILQGGVAAAQPGMAPQFATPDSIPLPPSIQQGMQRGLPPQLQQQLLNVPAMKPGTVPEGDPVPKDFHFSTDVVLDPNAASALGIAKVAAAKALTPAAGQDGGITFPYGIGLPTLVCAPLHLTTVELQSGEALSAPPQISDETRWDVVPTKSGIGLEERPIVMIRPNDSGLDANLVIPTNKRTYFFRLVSKPKDYMARVSFEYPEVVKPAVVQPPPKPGPAKYPDACGTASTPYKFKGDKKTYFYPLSACDNGTDTTYILLPKIILTMGAPVFMIQGPKKNILEPANWDTEGSLYIVHRLFYRGALVRLDGKKKTMVRIESSRGKK